MNNLMGKLQRDTLADEFAAIVARALRESTVPEGKMYVMGTGADHARLRGIPAIGRGVSGAIRGTDPEREACRDRRR